MTIMSALLGFRYQRGIDSRIDTIYGQSSHFSLRSSGVHVMDPLSDAITLLKPERFRTAGFDVAGAWAVRYDDQPGRIKCFAVTRGECWLAVEGLEPALLRTGDCFILPNGTAFTLATDLSVPPLSFHQVHRGLPYGGIVEQGGGGALQFVGVRFDLDGRQAAAIVQSLPPLLVIQDADDQKALRWAIEMLMHEMRDNKLGANLAAHHLGHMMLLQALRLYLAQPREGTGWFAALTDPQLGAAIGAVHADPARRWTLDALASVAAMSRSICAKRFRDRVGETPMAYITRWRMMLAAERLAGGSESLTQVAESVGYSSENAFNTAFKRIVGQSPRRYARGGGDLGVAAQ
jgi:AraC-like DNA-binding protein